MCRIIGLRALKLSEDNCLPSVHVEDDVLRMDFVYVAALELLQNKLDVVLKLGEGEAVHVRDMIPPEDLLVYLNTRDGKDRKSVADERRRSNKEQPVELC